MFTLVFGRGGEVGPIEHYRRELESILMVEQGKGRGVTLHNFMGLAHQRGFGVIFSGDDGQLTSVTAGDAFRILREQSGIYVMHQGNQGSRSDSVLRGSCNGIT